LKFEESKQITLAMMDHGAKKKEDKGLDSALKSNDAIRSMSYHIISIEELEETFETDIKESKSNFHQL
jgi:hypothetical protein